MSDLVGSRAAIRLINREPSGTGGAADGAPDSGNTPGMNARTHNGKGIGMEIEAARENSFNVVMGVPTAYLGPALSGGLHVR